MGLKICKTACGRQTIHPSSYLQNCTSSAPLLFSLPPGPPLYNAEKTFFKRYTCLSSFLAPLASLLFPPGAF